MQRFKLKCCVWSSTRVTQPGSAVAAVSSTAQGARTILGIGDAGRLQHSFGWRGALTVNGFAHAVRLSPNTLKWPGANTVLV